MTAARNPKFRTDFGKLRASRALKALRTMPGRWVCWKYVKRGRSWTKPPFKPDGEFADNTDPASWSDYLVCKQATRANGALHGVGFVLADDGIVALDLDGVLNEDGEIVDPEIAQLVGTLGTYTEISPSGVGLRCLILATLPVLEDEKRGFKVRVGESEVEVYASRRFVTLTGDRFPSTPDRIVRRQRVLDDLVGLRKKTSANGSAGPAVVEAVDLKELPRRLADLKANHEAFTALWSGKSTPAGADKSRSATMLALAGILARVKWTQSEIEAALAAWCAEHGHDDKLGREVERAARKAWQEARAEVAADEEIARLSQLATVAYEQARQKAAKKLGVRSWVLDELVEAKREAGRGGRLEFPEIVPWRKPVNGGRLISELVGQLQRFVALDVASALAVALWILHTHTFDAAFHAPRLAILSPTKRCGKSTLRRTIGRLVPRPLSSSNISPAAIFRVIEAHHPTLLLDEGDRLDEAKKPDLVAIINSSHCRLDATVIRTVGENHEPITFSTWAPIVLVAIGRLQDTWIDRSIVIRMRRRTKAEEVERMRRDQDQGFTPLVRQAARWAEDNFEGLRDADPELPEELNDRAQDNWRILIAIADLIGGDWSLRARQAALELAGIADDDDNLGVMLLADIRAVFGERNAMHTETLLEKLNALSERPWGRLGKSEKGLNADKMANLLKPFEIRSRQVKVEGHNRRGFRRAQFEEVWSRYLG